MKTYKNILKSLWRIVVAVMAAVVFLGANVFVLSVLLCAKTHVERDHVGFLEAYRTAFIEKGEGK